ncbi:hypothetical protein LLH06_03910 [Mucilaginibacter daejeonensis]|uniref:hypothetical protein n=1 Tax=Mucilaginibacter daejeonensis TaxID=398049 RepID=UPI001D17CEEF|nr:hypothetical protein [Mucilaginibacter daejeonensis]UEG54114.1 hypothetical protein LLH06_03910 [Mucilaginibacter daejeonensis]
MKRTILTIALVASLISMLTSCMVQERRPYRYRNHGPYRHHGPYDSNGYRYNNRW